ncbi:MAG: hypothetical protein ABI835_04800, partial [Chloroflexota bacterium]
MSFRRLTLFVMLLCSSVTIALVFGWRLFPNLNDSVLLRSNPCALPCFYGVTPGETTHDQAAAIFARYDPTTIVHDEPMIFTLPDSRSRTVLVSIFSNANGLVESIHLNAPPILADLLLTGQPPSHVFRT